MSKRIRIHLFGPVKFVGLHRHGKWLQTDNKFGITADFGTPSGGHIGGIPAEK